MIANLERPEPETEVPVETNHEVVDDYVYLIGRPPLFSIDKARTELGWEPRMPIEEGLKRTLEWLLAEEKKHQVHI